MHRCVIPRVLNQHEARDPHSADDATDDLRAPERRTTRVVVHVKGGAICIRRYTYWRHNESGVALQTNEALCTHDAWCDDEPRAADKIRQAHGANISSFARLNNSTGAAMLLRYLPSGRTRTRTSAMIALP